QKTKTLGIRANADTPEGAVLARKFGAQGIGLCRTERMFNGSDRINLFVEMIMAENIEERNKILKKLGQLQKSDFIQILKAMERYEVTIRLLDPPLHEFLPNPEELVEKIQKLKASGNTSEVVKSETILKRARELVEINPMMGHRGVRVGITYPEIYEMQIRAVFEALVELTKKKVKAYPQIMIPQISSIAELNHIKKIYDIIKKETETKHKMKLKINFGTMIEVVRAALTAHELAKTAEFFSFGTNDLTQGTFSFSREDVEGKFLPNPEELVEKIQKLESAGKTNEIKDAKIVLKRARELAEVNPMMGHRGVRVGITYPEIYEMQIRAVFEALVELTKKKVKAHPQIMIPQISSIAELNHIKEIYDRIKKEVETKNKMKLKINFGTMIEVVRAALTANELATTAEFFSFGTNDLTQGTFSFSREDVEGKFLPEYMEKELLERNPFQSIDVNGVGNLINIGLTAGRKIRKNMEVGICGEHGGDPSSIKFCHKTGLSYVSASPHRIPIAIVAAAQAAIENPKRK
ncbi:MAG: hypothetical protein HOM02_03455, partial [Thaumarchaeota archaeon]|nr:hypothetical protein [Nitrososphaerota archaeon]